MPERPQLAHDLAGPDRRLPPGLHVLELYDTLGEVTLTGDDREAGPAAVRVLHRALEPLRAVREVGGDTEPAQFGDHTEEHPAGLLPERHREHTGGRGEFELHALRLQRQHRTVD